MGSLAVRCRRRPGVASAGHHRGELRRDLDLEIAVDLLLGPIYRRLVMSGERLMTASVDRLVRAVIANCR